MVRNYNDGNKCEQETRKRLEESVPSMSLKLAGDVSSSVTSRYWTTDHTFEWQRERVNRSIVDRKGKIKKDRTGPYRNGS